MDNLHFIPNVRTGFNLNPKIGMDSGPTSPNNKFVESGEKASLNLEKRFRLLVFKEKSYTCNNAEIHPRSCPGRVINSLKFFRFTVVFLQPFFLSFAFFFLSLWIPFRVIYHGFRTIFTIHVWVRCWKFPCPILHLLEPSAISCKAACLLFRHHLHINAARELVGKHLMWR